MRGRRRRLAATLAAVGLFSTVAAAGVAAADDRQPTWNGSHSSGRAFERLATFPVYLNSADPTVETVAEITAASTDGRTLISTDSPGERVTFTDITDPRRPRPGGALGRRR